LVEKLHIEAKLKAIQKFDSIKKMGGSEVSNHCLKSLIIKIDEMLPSYQRSNAMRSKSNSLKTPIVLFALMIICYAVAGVFSFIWINFMAFVFRLGFYACLATLVFFVYASYNGEYERAIRAIDNFSILISNKVSWRIIYSFTIISSNYIVWNLRFSRSSEQD
jgi:hypothetical protein